MTIIFANGSQALQKHKVDITKIQSEGELFKYILTGMHLRKT